MQHIYEKVKAKSKFYKVINELNLSGQPTTSGAAPGALAGAAPGVITPGSTGASTQVVKAQADVKKSEEALKKASKIQAQQEINNINTQVKQYTNMSNSGDPAQKAQAQAAIKDANIRLKQLQDVLKQK